MSKFVHQEPPEVTLPDPPDADGGLVGAWNVELESLESSESEVPVWLEPSVVVVVPVWLALWLPVVPEKPLARKLDTLQYQRHAQEPVEPSSRTR